MTIKLDYENDDEKLSIAQWAEEVGGLEVSINGRGDVVVGWTGMVGRGGVTYKHYIDPNILHQYLSGIISRNIQHPYHMRYPEWLAKKARKGS